MKTQPMLVPLAGMTEATSDIDARQPVVAYCENLDFTKAGQVQGRPGFKTHNLFGARRLDTNIPPTTIDGGASEFSAFTPAFDLTSMFKHRDSFGERPGIAANGRVFTWEDARWTDKLYCGSARVERVVDFLPFTSNYASGAAIPASVNSAVVAYNYMQTDTDTTGNGSPLLSNNTPSIELYLPGYGKFLYGGSCTVPDNLGNVYHCTVGNDAVNNNLILVTRKNNDTVLTTSTLKTDCATYVPNAGIAIAKPAISTDYLANAFYGNAAAWVAYRQTGGNINVLRINAALGTVIAQSAFVLANVMYIGIASNASTNTVALCMTQNGVAGLQCKTATATTCVIQAGTAQTIDATIPATNPTCVIGWLVKTLGTGNDSCITAYCHNNHVVSIGIYQPLIPNSFVMRRYGNNNTNQVWGIAHQPVTLYGPNKKLGGIPTGNPRTVLGLKYHSSKTTFSSLLPVGRWVALDFTDAVPLIGFAAAGVFNGGTKQPGILAYGSLGTVTDSTGGTGLDWAYDACLAPDFQSYRFASWDVKSFTAVGGLDPALGLNQVSLIYPRAANIGDETVISGAAPHSLVRGYAIDTTWVQDGPEVVLSLVAGGMTVGSYTVQAMWRYIDDAGVTHRSAPSAVPKTITVGAAQNISISIDNCEIHNKEVGTIYIDVYMTQVNPTSTSLKTLLTTVTQTPNSGSTVVTTGIAPLAGAPALYTNNGAILANDAVSADGGVTVVNKRMFVSDGRKVFASKLMTNAANHSVEWSTADVLTINLPAPAGRILALEGMDDKLFIFCERGVYMTQGDGPDDTGIGNPFLVPVQISDLGVSSECGTVVTSHGIVFHTKNTTAAGLPGFGGLSIVTRSLTVSPISMDIIDDLSSMTTVNTGAPGGDPGFVAPCHLAYVPDRDLLVVNFFNGRRSLLVLDMRREQGGWSLWTNPNGAPRDGVNPGTCLTTVGTGGVLWAAFDNTGTTAKPTIGSFDGLPGTDDPANSSDVSRSVTMMLRTNNIFANTVDGLSWSRIRAITPFGDNIAQPGITPLTYTVNMNVIQDQVQLSAMTPATVTMVTAPGSAPGTYPSSSASPEFRLPSQKCAQIQVELFAKPAVAKWSALRFDVIPGSKKAPAATRH